MKIEFDAKREYSIIKISGEIDVSNFREIETSFSDYKELADQKILLDLSKLEYIDSSGVGALVRFYRIITANEGTVGIFGCNECIEKNFRLIRLDQFFKFFKNLEEALSS